jgi:hypothetical protein
MHAVKTRAPMEMLHHDGAHGMKRRQARRSRRRRLATAEERQQVTQMMRARFPQVFAFSDRLADLKKSHGVNPERVEAILVSPYRWVGHRRRRSGQGRQRPRWTVPPSDRRFWAKAPAEIPDGAPWLNPNRWPWLRARAVRLNTYLMTTKPPNPPGPYHIRRKTGHGPYGGSIHVVTAELIVLRYRPYFRRLVFTADNVRVAINTAHARAARTTSH